MKEERADRKRRHFAWGWNLPLLLALALLLILITALAQANTLAPNAKEAEVKQNLHTIQVAVEHYAVDHQGSYPDYLIGGEGRCSNYTAGAGGMPFSNVHEVPDRAMLSDPLLRDGYLDSYPKNPFVAKGGMVERFQNGVRDRLSNSTGLGAEQGTRFGALCDVMGSVLGDFRYPSFVVTDPSGIKIILRSYADIEYPFFDIWQSDGPKSFLPGNFFYKSMGPMVLAPGSVIAPQGPVLPLNNDMYILGAYGSTRTRGKDILGPEPVLDVGGVKVPAWTRSTMRETDETGSYLGSPYGVVEAGSELAIPGTLAYGCPNGIPDAIILVLTSEEESEESK